MERYSFRGRRIVREINVASRRIRSTIDGRADAGLSAESAWWQSFLRGSPVGGQREPESATPIRSVDAFSGCGGFTLGVSQAALALGRRLESVAAIDVDAAALEIHEANFGTRHLLHGNAASMVDFHVTGSGDDARFAYEPEILDPLLARAVGKVDVLVAGPPCQGHSNLNNRTRREDPRNVLFLTAVAIAVALHAQSVAIENVPSVINDKSDVVTAAKALLRGAGYTYIDAGVLAADELGGAQRRRRFFLLAGRASAEADKAADLRLADVAEALRREPESLAWAIGDLVEVAQESRNIGVFDSVPVFSEENVARIDYLFDKGLYDLPNEIRPDCHKNGHTYPSVYGRLRWDEPAQTITTGFLTPGRGRYIHPLQRRVLTPREAARLQAFPDSFRFIVNGSEPPRNSLCKWIGDAVPPLLGYAAALPLIARMI